MKWQKPLWRNSNFFAGALLILTRWEILTADTPALLGVSSHQMTLGEWPWFPFYHDRLSAEGMNRYSPLARVSLLAMLFDHLLLAYGKTAGLDACFVPVMA